LISAYIFSFVKKNDKERDSLETESELLPDYTIEKDVTEFRGFEIINSDEEEEKTEVYLKFKFPGFEEFNEIHKGTGDPFASTSKHEFKSGKSFITPLVDELGSENGTECVEKGKEILVFNEEKNVKMEFIENSELEGTQEFLVESGLSEKNSLVTESENSLVDSYSDGFLSDGDFGEESEFDTDENGKMEDEFSENNFDDEESDIMELEEHSLQNPDELNTDFLSEKDFNEDVNKEMNNNVGNDSEKLKSNDDSDCGDSNKLESLWEHQELIEQLKMELRKVRASGLPTILEESESPKIMEELKPWKIDEQQDWMGEIHKFYKSYREKMRKFDILNYQKMYAMGFLQLKNPLTSMSNQKPEPPTLKSIVSQNLFLSKHKVHGSDPMKKLIKELEGDLEVVYVGHMCLSWEFLYWQHEKALDLWDSDPRGILRYNEVAGEFQQFQVLMQRFIEDEPFQGPRVPNYVKSRCVLRNLLQVPVIRDDNLKDRRKARKKDRDDEYVITSDMLVEIVEESIRIFWQFIRADKDCTIVASNGHKKVAELYDPEELKLLVEVRKNLQKKEKKLKDLLRSENCILRRFRKEEDSDQVYSSPQLSSISWRKDFLLEKFAVWKQIIMGKKSGKYKKKESNIPVKKNAVDFNSDDEDMMNDEIDAFHKQRDVVPLNMDDDIEDSDEDNEQPVFDLEDDDQDDEDEDDDDEPPKGLAAKIVRTQKYLREKFGGVEDEELDDAEEEEEEKGIWGRKSDLYGGDVDYEPQTSDDEDAAAEEAEVLKLQSEKAKALSLEDYGLVDQDETEREPTFEDILDHGKPRANDSLDKVIKEDAGITYEIVKKDLNTLTKEEQMDVVYSSAPELVGLLSELNDALEQLENKVNPLLEKIGGRENAKKGEMNYVEVKQLLLQSFCQAITFYLLLKSEGHPVRDHPVVSRLVEIKTLLDKMKEMDENLPFDVEEFVKKDVGSESIMKLVEESAALESDSLTNGQMVSKSSAQNQIIELMKEADDSNTLNIPKNNKSQRKSEDKQVGVQSMEMLKVRAALEEKLKQKGVYSSIAPKNAKVRENLQPVNSQLETFDDFDDEAMELDKVGKNNGDAGLSNSSRTSQLLNLRPNKRKMISGDDDLPKRDDIGERRRKHELRVLAGAGVKSFDGGEDDIGNLSSDGAAASVDGESDTDDSDVEFYKQVEKQHAAKLAAKSDKYSRTAEVFSSLPDEVADGKRHITNQIEKNRGLTRARKKLIKNPRKKYKLKHKKAEVRRKGQVRDIRKPTGHYGGEASGINASISRSALLIAYTFVFLKRERANTKEKMVQRLTYRKRHSYATKSNQHRVVKTPGDFLNHLI
ncbi:hypothetical protein RD792_001406, partial [Penstemon davidsonii]